MQKIIEVSKIFSSGNVRDEKDDTLLELKESIEKNGLIHPIAVRKVGDRYEIIAGHRRFEAVKMIGEPFIECNILEDVSDKDRYILQVEENIHRQGMSAYELVCVFDDMKEKYGFTDKQIAVALHKDVSFVANTRYAWRIIEKEYENGVIPEEKKKLAPGTIRAAKKRAYTPSRKELKGKGYHGSQSGHTYMIFCSDYEFEQRLNEFLAGWL